MFQGGSMENKNRVVLASRDEVSIRANAATFDVTLFNLKADPEVINVRKGEVLAMALDKAEVPFTSPEKLDIRLNGSVADLLTVLEPQDQIYIAQRIEGAAK